MIFQNYSQTYAANITAVAGMAAALMAVFGIDIIGEVQMQFVVGTVLNFGGLIWSLVQRYKRGDVTVGGFRKDV